MFAESCNRNVNPLPKGRKLNRSKLLPASTFGAHILWQMWWSTSQQIQRTTNINTIHKVWLAQTLVWCWNWLLYKRTRHLTSYIYIFGSNIIFQVFKIRVPIELTRYWSILSKAKFSCMVFKLKMTKIEILYGNQLSSWNIFPLPRSLCSDMYVFLLETPGILHSGISVYCWNVKYSSTTEKYTRGKRHHCNALVLFKLRANFGTTIVVDMKRKSKHRPPVYKSYTYVTNRRKWYFHSNSIKIEFDCLMMCQLVQGLNIPDICYGSHGYTRVKKFWPV